MSEEILKLTTLKGKRLSEKIVTLLKHSSKSLPACTIAFMLDVPTRDVVESLKSLEKFGEVRRVTKNIVLYWKLANKEPTHNQLKLKRGRRIM